jgi:molybdopterin-guanine dinucleotide biosynthesis protein A
VSRSGVSVAAAIIAGGPAKRMGGQAKAFLHVDGQTIAERQLASLRSAFESVLVVAKDPAAWAGLHVEVVTDRIEGAGPLGGIEAALSAAAGFDAVVCVAGDLPFLSPRLLAELRDRVPVADAVAPRRGGRAEPLCARYARALQPIVAARLGEGNLAVHELLESIRVDWIDDDELAQLDPEGHSFLNINTPEDLSRAETIARDLRRRP